VTQGYLSHRWGLDSGHLIARVFVISGGYSHLLDQLPKGVAAASLEAIAVDLLIKFNHWQ
jgi:hypothetical protein